MNKPVTLMDAPRVSFNFNGCIMFTGQKVEIVHLSLMPGEEVPLHSNPFDVVFYQLQGNLELKVDDDTLILMPDTAILALANQSRGLANKTEALARVLVIKIYK